MITKENIKRGLKQIAIVYVKMRDQDCEYEIWPSDKLDELNKDYNVEEFLPGYYAVGSDGGGEMLVVELSTACVYAVPFIPMEKEERVLVERVFYDLLRKWNSDPPT